MRVGVTQNDSRLSPVLVANALFVFVGLSAGVGGILLPAQMDDYGVDRSTIGLTFFTSSAGFFVAGATAGPLIGRYGVRHALLGGTTLFAVAGAVAASRPRLVVFLLIQVLVGYAVGLFESVLNAFLIDRPQATTLLNRLHAFFGVGALLGPILAAWMLTLTTWPMVWAVLAAACLPLAIAVGVAFPPRDVYEPTSTPSRDTGSSPAPEAGLLPAALRRPGVVLGAVLLAVYVGLELGVGRWGYSYLVDVRTAPGLIAGYTMSAYWLGLTLGRFLISPVVARLRMSSVDLVYGCLAGVVAAGAMVWAVPSIGITTVGFVLMGFFLGPIFPTTIAAAPQLASPRLVPTAIGVMNAGSVLGGAALPWLAGAVAQDLGAWTLAPYAIVLALLQVVVWRGIVQRIHARAGAPRPAADPGLE